MRRTTAFYLMFYWLVGGMGWTVSAQSFVHPGTMNVQADFDRMKARVQAGAHPWVDSWSILTNNSYAQTNYTPHPQTQIVRGGTGTQNYQYAYQDAAAAYQLGLRWQITGDNNYANAATNILNQWANTCTNVTGDSNFALAGGLYGYEFACAAENLRTYANWNAADFAKFQSFMTNVFYAANNYFLTYHNGTCSTHYWANWDLCNMASMLAIGVLCDRRDIYHQAISYYTNGIGAGAASNVVTYLHPGYLGQCQESGRDQGHCTLDPVLLGVFCQIAWNQGDDMFGYNNNELLALSEYVCKYNVQPLANTVPFVCYMNCEYYNSGTEAGGVTPYVSANSRGTMRPGWSLIYNHYVNRRGLSAPYTGLMAAQVSPEGGGGNYGATSGGFDQLGFTALTHALDAIAPAVVPGPSALVAQARNNTVTLSWWGSAGATSYNVKRAVALAGPYTNIASVPVSTQSYTDIGLTQGTTCFYEVSAVVGGVETTNSLPASATPNLLLRGTVIGSSSSYQGAGAEKINLFDGNLNDCYDALNASGDWGGLDFGRSNVITQVAFCPRPIFASRMVGGQFQGCNVADFSSGVVTLYTIASAPAYGVLTYQTISNPNGFRYVRYLGPANGSGNAAEIQFFGAPPVPTPPAAPLDLQAAAGNAQAVLCWSEADTATSYNVKRGTVSGGPYTVTATNVLTTTFTDTGLGNTVNYFYVVSAVNAAGEGSNSTEVAVTPSRELRDGSLAWSGGTNGIWDVTSPNWVTNWQPAAFQSGNAVLFDDSAWLASITIPASVSPSAVTFNNNSKSYTVSGSPIAGATAVQIIGAGSVTFSSPNTFSGGTTLAGGTMILGDGNAFGTGAITLAGGSWLFMNNVTVTNRIIVQTNTTTAVNESTYGANMVLSGNLSGGGNLTTTAGANFGGVQLSGNNSGFFGALTVNNSGSQRFRFLAATAGSSNAVWTLNNNTGDGQSANFGNGTLYFGALSGNGQFRQDTAGTTTLEIGALNQDSAFSGVIYQANSSDIFSVNKVGTGTLTFSGANGYSGGTTIKAGTLKAGNASALGSGGTIVSSSATLDFGGQSIGTVTNVSGAGVGGSGALVNSDAVNAATLNSEIINGANFTVGGAGSLTLQRARSGGGPFILTKIGAGTLTLGNASATSHDNLLALDVESASTVNLGMTGSTIAADRGVKIAAGGTVRYTGTSANMLSDGPEVIVGNGTLDLNGHSDTAGKLTIGDGVNNGVISGGAASIYTVSATSTPFGVNATGTASSIEALSGSVDVVLAGSGIPLNKTTSGTVTLSQANTYSGNTAISAGTLALSGGGALASANVSIASGAALDVSAIASAGYSLAGALTMNLNKTGSTLTQGRLVIGSKNLAFGGALTVNASGSALANGDSFALVSKTSGALSGWFSGVTLPALSAGLTWDTNDLATGGVLDVYNFSTNAVQTMTAVKNTATALQISKLTGKTAGARGVVAVSSVSSASGASVAISGANINYTPPANFTGSDTFTAVLTDGHGSITATVLVTVNNPNVSLQIAPENNGSGFPMFTASGIPGTNYIVQISTNLPNWNDYATNAAAANGFLGFTDAVPLSSYSQVFYRLRQQ